MNHLYVTFEDTTGKVQEIDVTAGIISNAFGENLSEDEYIQTWVNAGMKVISTRYGVPGSPLSPPSPTLPGTGCLLSILSIFGI
jgi:hypothetical protein